MTAPRINHLTGLHLKIIGHWFHSLINTYISAVLLASTDKCACGPLKVHLYSRIATQKYMYIAKQIWPPNFWNSA